MTNSVAKRNENTLQTLREVLFDTINGVKNGTIKIDQAKAVNETSRTIINSLKAEIDYIRLTGGKTRFIDQTETVEFLTVDTVEDANESTTAKHTDREDGTINPSSTKTEPDVAQIVTVAPRSVSKEPQDKQPDDFASYASLPTTRQECFESTGDEKTPASRKTSRKTSTGVEIVEEKNGLTFRTHSAGKW